jgi:nucleotide-binding universal stress UspA family protein
MLDSVAHQLRGAGLSVTPLLREGDPKRVLLSEAIEWGADCIFVGAHGLSRLERLMIGSISSSVATRASCSVAVIRP